MPGEKSTGPGKPRDPREAEPKPPYPEQQQDYPGAEHEMRPRPDYGVTTYVGHGRLKDKVALVTGGDSGIGRAVCLAFAREGADVAFTHLPAEQEDADVTRRAVEESGRAALPLTADLAEESQIERVIAAVVDRFGRIDVLVNNAATQGKTVPLEELTDARLVRTFRVNIIAMFHMVRHALRHMPAGGAIINVSSIQAYQPSPSILDYAATKGAIVAFTKGLASDLAKRGIRANSVAPGAVWTPLIPQSFEPEHLAQHGTRAPLERSAQPAELAPAFVFLASDESRYVSGEVLGVTGGLLLA